MPPKFDKAKWDKIKTDHPKHAHRTEKMEKALRKGKTPGARARIWLMTAIGELYNMVVHEDATYDEIMDAVQIVVDNREINRAAITDGIE